MLAGEGEPLLRKHANEVLLREVTGYESRAELPFTLPSEVRGRSGEDGCRAQSKDPVTRVRRREQLQQSRIAQPGVPVELAGGGLVRDNVVEGHDWPRDQIQILGQTNRHHRLEIPVVVPMAVVQQEVVELALYGPDAADRVAELPVQIARRFSVPRGLAGDILIRGFTDRAETKLFPALQRNEQRNMRVLGKRLSDRTSACIRFFRRTSEVRNKPCCNDKEVQE